MKRVVKDIGVDAGLILISDKTFYEKYDGIIDEKLCKKIKVTNGNYKVNWQIKKTWNGDVSGQGLLKVTTGEFIVSDPCYHIHSENDQMWMKVLEDTNYFRDNIDGCIVLDSMGGDGLYNVHLNLELIGD